MYKNIGKKIKILAQVWGWLLLVGGLLTFFILLGDYYFDEVWFVLVGAVVGFVFSWPLYGFGELVENVKKIADEKENRQ